MVMGAFFSGGGKWEQLGRAWAVWITALVVLGIQAGVTLGGGHDALSWIYEAFGLRGSDVLEGKVWQLFTYAWLHGGFVHAGMNVLCLVMLGSRIEHVLGRAGFFKALAAGIAGGGVAHVLIAARGGEAPILVGLSGGCVGLLLLLTTLSPGSRMWPLPVSGRSLGMGIIVAELLLALADPQLRMPGFSMLGEWMVGRGMESWFLVGHACHFGGGCAGWMMGRWWLRPRISITRLRRDRERREARMREREERL